MERWIGCRSRRDHFILLAMDDSFAMKQAAKRTRSIFFFDFLSTTKRRLRESQSRSVQLLLHITWPFSLIYPSFNTSLRVYNWPCKEVGKWVNIGWYPNSLQLFAHWEGLCVYRITPVEWLLSSLMFTLYCIVWFLLKIRLTSPLDGFVSMMFVLGGSVSSQVIESSCLTLISHFYSYPENNGP